MHLSEALALLSYCEVAGCLAALATLLIKRQWSSYWSLICFLAVRAISDTVLILSVSLGHLLGKVLAYEIYFAVYWSSFALESILGLVIVFSIFRLAMAPLKGLQGLGTLVFKWAGCISVAVAVGTSFGPHLGGLMHLNEAVAQLQRTQSVLTICLLTFVCFAIRPMGLDFSSRIFGVSLGLGILATNDLLQAALLSNKFKLHTANDIINGVVTCSVFLMWTAYFARPEPKRRLIVLPTTSPFLRWNQISMALGDAPGFVAVGGFPPELFAPAEVEMMRRASEKMVTQFPRSVGA